MTDQPDSVERLAVEMRRVRGGAEHPGPPGCVCGRCRWAARMEALFAAERERYAKLLADHVACRESDDRDYRAAVEKIAKLEAENARLAQVVANLTAEIEEIEE